MILPLKYAFLASNMMVYDYYFIGVGGGFPAGRKF
jgi:hypothetical protein